MFPSIQLYAGTDTLKTSWNKSLKMTWKKYPFFGLDNDSLVINPVKIKLI